MKLLLAPVPQDVEILGGTRTLAREGTIILHGEATALGESPARRLQASLSRYAGVHWEIRAASSLAEIEGLVVSIDHEAVAQAEGYHLTVGDERIGVVARDGAGLQHAFSTLTQLVRQFARRLPLLHIEDWPAFRHRGVLLDVSRDRVPTMETLFGLVDMLAEWKITQLQFNMEHAFNYEQHRVVWKDASPFTGDEMLALDARCRNRHIELVPMQNSFGHMERWLKHRPYRSLAETPGGFRPPWADAVPWARKMPAATLDPSDPRSIALIEGLYDELLPHYTSGTMNAGCDETFELGHGKSAQLCAERGTGRVYLDFVRKIQAICERHSRRMMFWGDVVLQHPELIGEIPREVTVLQWGYEHDHPFDRDGRAFAKAKLPFYICPGAGGWNSFLGRSDNTVANIRRATLAGLTHGASGVLTTEWGDNGHMQPPPVAWPGMMYGAAMSWSPEPSAGMDLPRTLSLHAFDDPSGVTGRVAYDLGNAYTVNGARTRNGSLLHQLYFLPLDVDWPLQRVRPGGFDETREYLDATAGKLDSLRMRRPDAALIVDELRCAGALADAGAMIGAAKQARFAGAAPSKVRKAYARTAKRIEAIVPEYERLWLQRSRPGGLRDSVARLRATVQMLQHGAEN